MAKAHRYIFGIYRARVNRLAGPAVPRYSMLMLLPVLMVVLAMFSCDGGTMPDQSLELTAADNGDVCVFAVGDELRVTLESNLTTGFQWRVAAVDPAVLEVVGGQYLMDPAAAELDGAGGQEVWTFHAVAAGTTELRLEYIRPWEPDNPATTFSVTVVVE